MEETRRSDLDINEGTDPVTPSMESGTGFLTRVSQTRFSIYGK